MIAFGGLKYPELTIVVRYEAADKIAIALASFNPDNRNPFIGDKSAGARRDSAARNQAKNDTLTLPDAIRRSVITSFASPCDPRCVSDYCAPVIDILRSARLVKPGRR